MMLFTGISQILRTRCRCFTPCFPHFIGKKLLSVNICLPPLPGVFIFGVTFGSNASSNGQKPTDMRNKTIIGTLLLALALAGIVLVFQSSKRASTNSSNKESMDASCQKKGNDGKMIWENLSHQF